MRGIPVFIMNRAGEWLFDSVKTECRNAILSTCRPRFGKISETILPRLAPGREPERRLHQRTDLVLEEAGRVLERRVELAHRLAVPAIECRLVLPGIDLAGPAVGEDPDDPLGPGAGSAPGRAAMGFSDPSAAAPRTEQSLPLEQDRPARSARTRRRHARATGGAKECRANHRSLAPNMRLLSHGLSGNINKFIHCQ